MGARDGADTPTGDLRDRQLEALRARILEMSPGSPATAARSADRHARGVDDVLPVLEGLAAVLPDSGLRRGTIISCTRGSLLLALLAGATAAGKWAAVVGNPQIGLLALHEMGGRLDRLAHIADPGPDALAVVAVLLDGIDVIVLDHPGCGPASRTRAMAARVRSQSAVLIITESGWLRPDVRIEARPSGYVGLGTGWGCVNAISFDLRVSERGGRPRVGSVTLSKSEAGTRWRRSSGAADGGESDVRRRTG